MFSAAERKRRDRWVEGLCRFCASVIVSSEVAARDLQAVNPEVSGKLRVLRFASGLTQGESLPSRSELQARYALPARYIHVPNQFWRHKNHELLVDALRTLKERGRFPVIVATGRMEDYRHPHYVRMLLDRVQRLGLGEAFRPLGIVPYRDMLGIMRFAAAVCNPSKFEGWSTSVEEAKSLGKRLLLSDIPVHREQAPDRAVFFESGNANEAAEAIWAGWSAFDPARDEESMQQAAAVLPARVREFALRYQAITTDAAERGQHSA
jgi:glycosyltransferase involved in cell wall biosynthesis